MPPRRSKRVLLGNFRVLRFANERKDELMDPKLLLCADRSKCWSLWPTCGGRWRTSGRCLRPAPAETEGIAEVDRGRLYIALFVLVDVLLFENTGWNFCSCHSFPLASEHYQRDPAAGCQFATLRCSGARSLKLKAWRLYQIHGL